MKNEKLTEATILALQGKLTEGVNAYNITLDDIAQKASELGFEVMNDDRDDEGLTLLIYPANVDEEKYDDFYDYDVEGILEYLDSIPTVRYQTDNEDPHTLAVWLKEI